MVVSNKTNFRKNIIDNAGKVIELNSLKMALIKINFNILTVSFQ